MLECSLYSLSQHCLNMNLSQLYSDPKFPGSFGGVERFYREVKKKYPVTRRQIKDFIKSQNTYNLHKQIRKPREYRRVYTHGINDLWQADLLDLQKFKDENKQYRYACFVIDVFSKRLWVKPLKFKTAAVLTKALALLIMMNRPKKLQCDQGTEFFNKKVAKMLEAFGVKLYHSYSDKKASVVERVQRTIRSRLYRAFTHQKNHEWISIIDNLVDSYNRSYHRSIKMAPADVKPIHTKKIHQTLYPNETKFKKRATFNVGDLVKIIKVRKTFKKEADHGWTVENFTIKTKLRTKPITYLLQDLNGEDISGSFYSEELQHVS